MSNYFAGAVKHPKVYVYTTAEFRDSPWEGGRGGRGLLKIGETDRNADLRIREQVEPVKMPKAVDYEILLVESAVTVDGRVFRDKTVHKALERAGVSRRNGEWFECTVQEVEAVLDSIKHDEAVGNLRAKARFRPRPEQEQAVLVTSRYFKKHAHDERPPHFLWNAKMRFGKTFTSYQLAKEMGWSRILVLTYKPAVETAWREDLETHIDFEGWKFKGKEDPAPDLRGDSPLVWFASFQDVLGTDSDGQPKAKNAGLYEIEWDAVFVDEYHFGAWRDAARALYSSDKESDTDGDTSEKASLDAPDLDEDFTENFESVIPLRVKNFLYLSGTPFRALTEGEFLEEQVYNWTYGDEQKAKNEWEGPGENPYLTLPKMHLLVYSMPPALREVALNNYSEFSLTEFFKAKKAENGSYVFVHEKDVQKWLDLIRGQDIKGLWSNVSNSSPPPLPYENVDLLQALQHTIWYLPDVGSCLAMKDLLEAPHNTFFRTFKVIAAAGNKAGIGEKALPPVVSSIGNAPQDTKTITLSCAKLMTGVTVPAWTGIFMLRELKSPESYFQAAFRVQSPWSSRFVDAEAGGQGELIHKQDCFVFDFSPNRALKQIVDYATRLQSQVASERDDEAAIKEFMEFLPVLSFEGYGMESLKAADVLNYLTRGTSSSMLARRWNSPELLRLDVKAMENLLDNQSLLDTLENIELFRNITEDLKTMISTNKELRSKTLAKEPLSTEEKERKSEAAKKRENLKKRLQRFVTRIPAFMYLTDDREKSVHDIITQVEPELFHKVTALTLEDYAQLIDAGVFNDSKMNDAVWMFRTFEEPSLSYTDRSDPDRSIGGWDEVKPRSELNADEGSFIS
jgi:hypothetical protein